VTTAQIAIRYVLPVLLATSCFRVTGDMARGVGNNDSGAISQNFQRIRQRAPRRLTVSSCTVAADGAAGAKCDVSCWCAVARAWVGRARS